MHCGVEVTESSTNNRSIHAESFNRNMKALEVFESKWDPIRKKLGRRLLEEQDKRSHTPLWRGAGGGGLLAGTRRRPAAEDGVPPSLPRPPHTHILLARSPAPYSPFRRRPHSPTAFSGPMARPPPSPPRPPPSHMHAGWMVSATKTPTTLAPSQDSPF